MSDIIKAACADAQRLLRYVKKASGFVGCSRREGRSAISWPGEAIPEADQTPH
jgi:hypothetical protein